MPEINFDRELALYRQLHQVLVATHGTGGYVAIVDDDLIGPFKEVGDLLREVLQHYPHVAARGGFFVRQVADVPDPLYLMASNYRKA